MSSLRIANQRIRKAVLEGIPKEGPPSLHSRWARARYESPAGLDEAFAEATKITTKEMEQQAKVLEKLTQENADPAKIEAAALKSQFYNPEVRYNHLVQAKEIDMNLPIYRYLAKRDWARRDMLILMQRLEQQHVIPDTMPTLEPRAKVELKFETPAARWLEPAELVPNGVCERVPQLRVQEFEKADGLYTVLIVNPDIPDLENDSYTTGLHFAAVNIPLNNTNQSVDYAKGTILRSYIPPHPEKNAGAQRLAVWVFRQPQAIESSDPGFENFDIRNFASVHNLDAVGAHMWRVKWDRTTPSIREKYQLGPGRVYFRARTAKPEDALLHVKHRQLWLEKLN